MQYATKYAMTRHLLSLLLLLGFTGAVRAQAPAAEKPGSIAPLLKEDGTLDLRPGTTGSFDATGYRLAPGPDGRPRFVAAGAEAEGDENWDDRFGLPGVLYGPVNALAVAANGDVYVGGAFFSAGGFNAANVARWDGRRWWPLAEGVNRNVNALAILGDDVYAGGDFDRAGAVLANGIARWDGTRWSSLGTGVQDSYGYAASVYALAVVGGKLYAGGDFEKAGGADARGLAVWDGTRWSEAGGGVYYNVYAPTSYSVGTVYALTPAGDDLYVGGSIGFVGASPAKGIARLHTTTGTWSTFGEGLAVNDYTPGTVRAIVLRGNDVYAAGTFAKAGGTDAASVARWDAAAGAWAALGQGLAGRYGSATVYALAFDGPALYAAGDFDYADGAVAHRIARWENGAWSPVERNGLNGLGEGGGTANVLLVREDGFYLGGDFDTVGGVNANNLARLDAADDRWKALGEGLNSGTCCGYVNAVAVAPNGDVYAGGYFEFAGSVVAHSIARWDGTRWHALGEGLKDGTSNGTVFALTVEGDNVYVGGDFTTAGGRAATHVARWNAATQTWHALGSGTNGNVYDLAVGGDGFLYAAGDFSAAGTVDAEDVARWNGTAWSKLGQGITFNSSRIEALAVAGPYVFVGGDFSRLQTPGMAAPVDVDAFAFWDSGADAWYAPNEGGLLRNGSFGDFTGSVNDFELIGNDLYVSGRFDKAGKVSAFNIARFTFGAGWSALGSNVGGSYADVNALAAAGTDLYVAGAFETAGERTVNRIARWDGTAWTALGSGIAGDAFDEVNALAIHQNDLYAAGDFVGAGAKASHNFAHWTVQAGVNPAGQAAVAVDPLTTDFGEVTVGTPEQRMITVSNAPGATAPLTVSVGTPSGPFRVVQGGGTSTVAPGQSLQVLVAFDPQAAGAATGTLAITHSAPNLASPVTVTLSGTGAWPANVPVILRGFDPTGPQQLWSVSDGGGFVFGTNKYGDRAKAVLLTPPPGKADAPFTISKVNVWFAYKSPQVTSQTYTLRLYNGTATSGPTGAPLFSQSYRLADIRADADGSTPEQATEHVLPQPVAVNGSFFVVVDFGTYDTANPVLAAIAAGQDLKQRVAEVWEQGANGSWSNLSDAWSSAQSPSGWQPWIEASNQTATAADPSSELPAAMGLDQNYPNPFNPSTVLRYTLGGTTPVRLRVYDVRGRLLQTLVDQVQPAGAYEVPFHAADLPSGTYFYRLETPQGTFTRPMVLMR